MLNIPHNPDILTCLADLSSDEVFTPPNVANQMLDQLPKEIWSDESATFLDPVSKSGVFLREITKRLLDGLENKIPNIEQRLEHILKKQVFGIATTRLTSQISRRTLYCSKNANGEYSIVDFDDEEGNLKMFESVHFWADGKKCKYCGVSRDLYQRDKGLESYAYSFIHEDKPEELFNMKFDVIIGNPPYQMMDGGAQKSSKPIYHKFVESAIKMQPRFLSMIIPSRWFMGGKGLDQFRNSMLNDSRISTLVDYPDSSDCFKDVAIKGGVCYFLWERDNKKIPTIINKYDDITTETHRNLLEDGFDTFLRFNESISIVKKIHKNDFKPFSSLVSFRQPFGFNSTYKFSEQKNSENEIKIYGFKKTGYVTTSEIQKNIEFINQNKIFITRAYGAGESYPHQIINTPFIPENPSCCTETYLVVGPFKTKKQTENILKYMKTKFFRFCVLLNKPTQDATAKVYKYVPLQDINIEVDDEYLYDKYKLSNAEINFINKMIREID